MKPLILLPLILLPALFISEKIQVPSTVRLKLPVASGMNGCLSETNPSAYGPWQKVSCYKGLQFRTIRSNQESDGSYWWSVQFRNLYNSEVRFNYNIIEPEKEAQVRKEKLVLDSWRLSAGADPEREGYDSPHAGNYVRSAERVFVFITGVRLALNGDLDVPPMKCDY